MDEIELTKAVLREAPARAAARDEARGRLEASMRAPRQRLRRRALLAAAIFAVASMVITTWVGRWQPSAAAEALDRIATLPGEVLPDLGAGELIHRELVELRRDERVDLTTGERFSFLVEASIEEWVAPDLSGRRHELIRAVSLPSEDDRHAWLESGRPPHVAVGDVIETTFAPGEMTFVSADRVPTDREALQLALAEGTIAPHPQGDAFVFAQIGDLLAQGNLGRARRDALLHVAAALDGVRLDGAVEDPLGRPGIALSIAGPDGVETQLVFDESTGRVLATITRDASGVTWSAYVATAVFE